MNKEKSRRRGIRRRRIRDKRWRIESERRGKLGNDEEGIDKSFT